MSKRSYPTSFTLTPAGFTLVELLAAMTVLSLILLLMAQLFDGASRATTQSYRTMDIASEARLTFERMGDDLANMVRRGDVDYKLDKKPGSDALAFYAATSGYTSSTPSGFSQPRTLATLDYRIHQGTSSLDAPLNFKLERGARGAAYSEMLFTDQASPKTLSNQTYAPGFAPFNTLPLIPARDYTVLANQVFRLEFCYLLKNGRLSKTPNPPADTAGSGTPGYRPDPGGFKQVAALVVAIAMLDARNRVLLGDPRSAAYEDSFNRLAAALPDVDPDPNDAASAGQDILSVWQPQVLKIAARTEPNTSALPRPVTSNIRVFQRHFAWR